MLGQRRSTSPSFSWTSAVPQEGRLLGHHEGTLGAVARVLDGGDDLGDDAPALRRTTRSPMSTPLRALLGVVQGRARDIRACDQHGFHDAVGGHAARAAHLHADVEQTRVYFLGRKLVGGGPAWRARGGAERALEGQVVDLDDDAVDLVDEAVAVSADLGDAFLNGLSARQQASVGRDGQAPLAQLLVPAIWVVGSVNSSPASTKPMPWATIARGRLAVSAGSFWRREPAAALRALTRSFHRPQRGPR